MSEWVCVCVLCVCVCVCAGIRGKVCATALPPLHLERGDHIAGQVERDQAWEAKNVKVHNAIVRENKVLAASQPAPSMSPRRGGSDSVESAVYSINQINHVTLIYHSLHECTNKPRFAVCKLQQHPRAPAQDACKVMPLERVVQSLV